MYALLVIVYFRMERGDVVRIIPAAHAQRLDVMRVIIASGPANELAAFGIDIRFIIDIRIAILLFPLPFQIGLYPGELFTCLRQLFRETFSRSKTEKGLSGMVSGYSDLAFRSLK